MAELLCVVIQEIKRYKFAVFLVVLLPKNLSVCHVATYIGLSVQIHSRNCDLDIAAYSKKLRKKLLTHIGRSGTKKQEQE